MVKTNGLERMSLAQLSEMEQQIARLKSEKRNSEREEVRQELTALAKQRGFDINELFGKGRKGKGSVAVKYRDPKNAANTWTGRGRMPRWLTAATKGSKAKREDFRV